MIKTPAFFKLTLPVLLISSSISKGAELLAYYNFNGQTTDQTGNGANAILNGGGVISADAQGFTGTSGDRALDVGASVSFSRIVTFKSATDIQEAARLVPLDRMLIETDAPYLAPVPHRGKRNQPAYLPHTAQFVADLRDEPIASIAGATLANARSLFGVAGR